MRYFNDAHTQQTVKTDKLFCCLLQYNECFLWRYPKHWVHVYDSTCTHKRISGRGKWAMPPTWPSKFYERPSGASRTQENHIAAGPLPRAPLESLQRCHRPSRWLPTPKNLTRSRHFGPRALALRASPLTQTPKIGGVAPPSTMGWVRLRQHESDNGIHAQQLAYTNGTLK